MGNWLTIARTQLVMETRVGVRTPPWFLVASLVAFAATACGGSSTSLLGTTDAAAPDSSAQLDAGSPDAAQCPTGQVSCNGTCTDTRTDEQNCGACGVACAAGQVCSGGTCGATCGAPQTKCSSDGGAYCADLQTDNANCGACETTCAAGQVCSGGKCAATCGAPFEKCGQSCADTQRDPHNCGGCGVVCATGQVCKGGSCGTVCSGSQTKCSGSDGGAYCADLQTDNANCGACGTTCAAGQVCSAGKCAATCGAPLALCGAGDAGADAGAPYCADTQSDPDNCGGCGAKCGPYANASAACVKGKCQEICDAGYLDCSGTGAGGCNVDSQTDPDNCNGCGNVCGPYAGAAAECTSGTCGYACKPGYLDCDGLASNGCEVDPLTDHLNCGGCGQTCPMACVAGACRSVTVLAAGGAHTCAALDDGSVWCWGSNGYGELGDGTTTNRPSPVLVDGVTSPKQLALAVGYTCALLATGEVDCWGDPPDNSLYYYGGQPPTPVAGLTDAVAVAAGRYHACALLGDGTVQCWGENTNGQLGDGTQKSRKTPAPVPGLSGVKALSAGGEHTCAIMADNSIECWGDNQHGQLGYGGTAPIATSPQPVSSALKFVAVACGSAHTCALSSTSGVWCWGANDYGQLGDGTITQRPLPTQVAGPILSGAGTLGSSGGFTCYLSQGEAYCWGGTFSGILIVPTYAMTYVKKIAVGGDYACTLEYGGAFNGVECWGDNYYGQLGDGTTMSRSVPAPVVWQ